MKIKYVILLLTVLLAVSCTEDPFDIVPYGRTPNHLKIDKPQGIKLDQYIVRENININLKSTQSISTRIKIFDIQDRLVSQEKLRVVEGDNILKVFVNALPKSSYTILVEDQAGNIIGTELFSLTK